MAQPLTVGVVFTHAQINGKLPPTIVYTGYSLAACKAAVLTQIDGGSATKGGYISGAVTGVFTSRRNLAGT